MSQKYKEMSEARVSHQGMVASLRHALSSSPASQIQPAQSETVPAQDLQGEHRFGTPPRLWFYSSAHVYYRT